MNHKPRSSELNRVPTKGERIAGIVCAIVGALVTGFFTFVSSYGMFLSKEPLDNGVLIFTLVVGCIFIFLVISLYRMVYGAAQKSSPRAIIAIGYALLSLGCSGFIAIFFVEEDILPLLSVSSVVVYLGFRSINNGRELRENS